MITKLFKSFIIIFALLFLMIGCKSRGVKVASYKGGSIYLPKQYMAKKSPSEISKRIDYALKDRLLMQFAKDNGIYGQERIKSNADKFKYQLAYSYFMNKFKSKINVTDDMVKNVFDSDPQYKGREFDKIKDYIKGQLESKEMEKVINKEIYKYKPNHTIKINKEYLDFKKFPPTKSSLVVATIDDKVKITNNMVNNRMKYLKNAESPEKSLDYLINISIIRLESEKYINNKNVKKKLQKYYDNMVLRYMKLSYIFEKNPLNADILKKFYEDHIKDFYSHPELSHIRHILFDSEEKAKEVLQEILKSKNPQKTFLENAKKYARGPEILRENAGDLGEIPYGAMPEAFSKAAFSLKKNEIFKKVVKTTFGYHLIMCEGKKKPETLDFESNKKKVMQDLKNYIKITKFNEFLEKLVRKYDVKILYPKYKGVYNNEQKEQKKK